MPIGVDMRGPAQVSMESVNMMTAESATDAPRDTQQTMYDVGDNVYADMQARYGHSHDMRHNLWPTENNGGEYWNADYKYYSQ
jgi:hypothetical protein